MNATLPPGIKISPSPSAAGIKFGAGRPVVYDPETRAYMARSEFARKNGKKGMGGRPTIYEDADELAHACAEYFTWVDNNPLKEEKVQFAAKLGKWAKIDLNKKRPYTQKALCFYLGVTQGTWGEWRKVDLFKSVVQMVDEQIVTQKFEGAAAGFFNPNIIARDLGLVDKQELTGKDGGPIEKITSKMTPAEAAEAYAKSREQR